MMKKILCVLVLLVLLAAVSNAHAAYLYSWGGSPSQTDPTDTSLFPSQDILSAWHAYDSGYHYFRIDLRGAPDTTGLSLDFAGTYGLYIDSKSGGASGSHPYVPDPLEGIDYIVDSHFDPWVYTGGWGRHDYHTWNGSTFSRTDPIAEQQTENAGKVLEWVISSDDIGISFRWWAATHDFGSSSATYDVTTQVDVNPVPIPGAVLLFGSGLLGLLGFRKKFAR